mmetsp:Transcript_28360/g.66575  ORF Transcript_28360/g.66575 Transcript_28360/m.66575 type:complete len:417 (-) Transcript_28360:332-1582(-)
MFCRTMSEVSTSIFLMCSEVSSVLSLSMMILRRLRLLRRSAVLLSLFFPAFFLAEPSSSSSLSSPPIPTERLPPSRVVSRLSWRLELRPARGMEETSSPSRSKPLISLSSSGMGNSPSDISSRPLPGRGVRLSDPATEARRTVERRSEAMESSAPRTSSTSETELLRPLAPASSSSSSKTWRSSSSSSSSMRLASGSKAPHPSSSSSPWPRERRRSDPWWSIPLRSESRVRSAAAAAEVWVPPSAPSWVCVRSMARRAASPPAPAWESSAPPSSSSSSARTQPPAAPPWPPAASREKGTRKARPPAAPGTPETGTPRAERSTSSVSSSMLTGWMSRPPMGPAAAASSNSPKLDMLRPAPPLPAFFRPPAVGSRSTRAKASSPSSPSAPPCAPGRKAILILTMASWASCMRYLTLRE